MLNDIFIGVKRVVLAHELRSTQKLLCDYTKGRNLYGVSYALSGTAEYRLSSGECVSVSEGDTVFLSSDAKYTVLTKGHYHHYTVNFLISERFEYELLSSHGVTPLRNTNAKLYSELFRNITAIWSEKRSGYEMRSVSFLYLILSEFFHDLYLKNTDDFAHKRLSAAKDYIDSHPTENVEIKFLAKLVSMSETNFRREFSRLYGDSPIHYRDIRRISYAKDILSSGFYTISEAAYITGFSDASYFSRFFKKHTGMTPSDFIEFVDY